MLLSVITFHQPEVLKKNNGSVWRALIASLGLYKEGFHYAVLDEKFKGCLTITAVCLFCLFIAHEKNRMHKKIHPILFFFLIRICYSK